MRADKLRAWLERSRVGAHMLVLQHENGGESQTFATFHVEPLPEVETIFNACADLADELECSVRVAIIFVNEAGEGLCRCYHKQTPLEASSVDALGAADVSSNTIIAQLLRHIEVQQKAVTGSHMSIYNAFERTLAQLQKTIERQATQIQQLTDALKAANDNNATEEDDLQEVREEAIARRNAWEKLSEIGPVAAEFLLKAATAKITNGHASNGAAAA
jgi:uncharacterized coiled-coil protein SlyX